MLAERWCAVDGFLSEHLIGSDPLSEAALAASDAAGLPPIATSSSQGKLLELLVRIQGAQRILELGTLGAYSTIWLARALPSGGRLITCEADPHCAQTARANIAAAGLAERVQLREGPALETLAELDAEGSDPFDMIFVDADKASYPDYLQWSLKLSRPGSLLVIDNVIGGGAIIDANGGEPWSEDGGLAGVRRLYELLAAEPRIDATAIQTGGEKGHDGFVLAVVTDGQASR